MSYKFLQFFVVFFFLLFLSRYSFAQDNNDTLTGTSIVQADADSVYEDYDVGDTSVVKINFDDDNDSIIKFKQQRDFSYMAYLDSLLKKKKGLKKDTFNIEDDNLTKTKSPRIKENNDNSFTFLNSFPLRIFLWLVAIFFIGIILYKLFFTGGLFSKNEKAATEDITEKEPESLNDYSAYDTLINEAELKNDFNLATRYLYLQSLKKLSENELIIFSADKTNNLYVQELAGRSYQQEFSYLTLNYDYVWYGKFMIDASQYQKLKEQFILFNRKV